MTKDQVSNRGLIGAMKKEKPKTADSFGIRR